MGGIKYCFIQLILFVYFVNSEIRISLQSNWTVNNANNSIQVKSSVPSGIYTDLHNAGILTGDLFYRFNDHEYRWVAYDNWTYQNTFELPPNVLSKTAINLVFHGLDTVAQIYLNGQQLGAVDNMFVRHVFSIKDFLVDGANVLRIELKSPVSESLRRYEEQEKSYQVPPRCVPPAYQGECHANFLRKMQASFSWDWGPAFPSVGIWKPVEIEGFDMAVIRDLIVSSSKANENNWDVNVTVYIESARDELIDYVMNAGIQTNNSNFGTVVRTEKDSNSDKNFISYIYFAIDENSFDLWWPNGFGQQALYPLTVTLSSKNDVSSKMIKIGMRTVELVQEEISPGVQGRSFYFKVNGVPIFAKGSNWIPGHILPELGSDESRIDHILKSAAQAHMNMLRVWGGGVYESDRFYQLADELGILIWQDMMFACSMYPTGSEFLGSVKTEVKQQVRRLQHHPSVAIWAGNNENEAALRGNWYGTKGDFEKYKADYVKLYVDTIQPVVLANDNSRPFVMSSPSNGIESAEEGHVASNPYSPLFGDVHYYNYLSDSWDSVQYPNTRFASEYGFQAMPSFLSLSKVSQPEDWTLSSSFSTQRQHHILGYVEMISLIKHHLPLPKNDLSQDFYHSFIYYSQVSQAMGTKTETEKYRRDRSKLTSSNEGRTMGALYWQLNDVWQAPTWASIEFDGRWRMLHYFAKKFFASVLVSPVLTADEVKVYLISDLLEDVPQVQLNVSVYSWDSFQPKKALSYTKSLPNATCTDSLTLQLTDLMAESDCQKTTCCLYFSLTGPNFFSDNFIFPSPLKDATNLSPAVITVNTTAEEGANEVKLVLKTDKIAPFVWLETEEPGQFSDNGFTLIQETSSVVFSNRGKVIDLKRFMNSLIVHSLLDSVGNMILLRR